MLSFDATCQGLRPVRKGEAGTWTDYALPLTLLWAYLVVVLDLFARKTGGVGNEIQFSPDNKLTIRALEMVWERQGSTTGKSDPHTATTDGLMLIHLVYSGLASAITLAFRFASVDSLLLLFVRRV